MSAAYLERIANASKPKDIVEWAEREFVILDVPGKPPTPIILEPHQKAILRHAFTPNERGRYPYSTVVYSCCKKSGKSTIAALVMAWAADTWPGPLEIFSCANDEKQAITRGFENVQEVVRSNPRISSRATAIQKVIKWNNGTTIQALAVDYAGAAGSQRQALVVFDELWAACVSEDTEALTPTGWKKYSELSVGDLIAAQENGVFVWQPVKKLNVYYFDGQMVRLKHRRSNMLLTPNHRVWTRYRNTGPEFLNDSEWVFIRADEAMEVYEGEVPTQCGWDGDEPEVFVLPEFIGRRFGGSKIDKVYPERSLPIVPFMKLLGYYLSEGGMGMTDNGKNKHKAMPCGIYLYQRRKVHPEIHQDIVDAAMECGFEPTFNDTGVYIGNPQLSAYMYQFGLQKNRFIPSDIKGYSPNLLKHLFSAFMDGDGWIAGKGFQVHTTSPRLADDLIEVGLKLGYICKYMGVKQHNKNWTPIHRISFSLGRVTYDKRNWSKEYYRGVVWCPTVESGIWLARRKGTIYWTGNSGEAARRLYDELTPIPTLPISMRLVVTYAGFLGESKNLYEIYERAVKQGTKVPPEELSGLDLPCYRNETTFAYWDSYETSGEDCRRMTWQKDEDGIKYYQAQERELRPNAFRRLHWNMWTSNENSFLTPEVWDGCVDEHHKPISPDKAVILDLGVDASIRHDQASVVGVTYRDRERQVVLARHRTFKPTPENPLDLEETLEATVLEWWKNYTVRAVYYDPYQFHRSATTLTKIGVPMIEYPQSPANLTRMGQNLYELLTHKNLVLYKDPDLKTAATRAVAIETARGWRIAKEKSADKIDPLIALAHACIGSINTLSDRSVETEPHFNYEAHVYKPKEKGNKRPALPQHLLDSWITDMFNGTKPTCEEKHYSVLRPMMIETLERFAKTKDSRGRVLLDALEAYDKEFINA